MVDYINRDAEIILKASIFDQVLYEAVKICREIPEADAIAEDTFIDDRNNFRWKDVPSTGLRVFIAGIDRDCRIPGVRRWRHIKRYAVA